MSVRCPGGLSFAHSPSGCRGMKHLWAQGKSAGSSGQSLGVAASPVLSQNHQERADFYKAAPVTAFLPSLPFSGSFPDPQQCPEGCQGLSQPQGVC